MKRNSDNFVEGHNRFLYSHRTKFHQPCSFHLLFTTCFCTFAQQPQVGENTILSLSYIDRRCENLFMTVKMNATYILANVVSWSKCSVCSRFERVSWSLPEETVAMYWEMISFSSLMLESALRGSWRHRDLRVTNSVSARGTTHAPGVVLTNDACKSSLCVQGKPFLCTQFSSQAVVSLTSKRRQVLTLVTKNCLKWHPQDCHNRRRKAADKGWIPITF